MKTFPKWLYLLFMLQGFPSQGWALPDRALALQYLNNPVTSIFPERLSEVDRKEAIRVIRQEFPSDRNYLIRLRDTATIEDTMTKWEASGGQTRSPRWSLEKCASPWMLPLLAPYLHRDEPMGFRRAPSPEDKLDRGISHVTATVMRQIIVASPEISEAAKAWCRVYVYPHDEDPKQVYEMRRWWETNRENLEKERYDLLVPLPSGPAENSRAPTVTLSTPPSAPPSQPVPAAAVVDSPNVEPAGDSAWDWRWGAGVALLALTLLLVWFKRR